MRGVIRRHLLVLLFYLVGVTFLRLFYLGLPGSLNSFFELVGFWFGGVVGMALLDLDRFIHIYVEHSETSLSQEFRRFVKEQRWKEAAEFLMSRRFEQTNLAFRNGVFAIVFLPVVLFAFTSTSGMLGKGLAAGVMLHFLYDAWRDYQNDRERFKSWFLWMVQREVPFEQKRILLIGLTAAFGLLSLLLV